MKLVARKKGEYFPLHHSDDKTLHPFLKPYLMLLQDRPTIYNKFLSVFFFTRRVSLLSVSSSLKFELIF